MNEEKILKRYKKENHLKGIDDEAVRKSYGYAWYKIHFELQELGKEILKPFKH